MKFTVVWQNRVKQQLAEAYLLARQLGHETAPLNEAVSRVDELLQRSPRDQGESREDNERVLVEFPLSITFEIHDEEQVVLLTRVRYVRRP